MPLFGSIARILRNSFLGGIVVLLALFERATHEIKVDLVVGLRGEGLGLVELVTGFFEAAQPGIHLRQGHLDIPVLGSSVELRLGQLDSIVGFAGVGQLSGQHQLDGLVLGHLLGCLLGNLGGLVVLLGIAIGIHLALVTTLRIVAAHRGHLLVSLYGLIGFVLLAVDVRQAVEEDRAVVLFRVGVLTIGMVGLDHQVFENDGRFFVMAQGIVDQCFVEADLERVGAESLGLLEGGQRLIVVTLPPLDLGDAQIALRSPEGRPRQSLQTASGRHQAGCHSGAPAPNRARHPDCPDQGSWTGYRRRWRSCCPSADRSLRPA